MTAAEILTAADQLSAVAAMLRDDAEMVIEWCDASRELIQTIASELGGRLRSTNLGAGELCCAEWRGGRVVVRAHAFLAASPDAGPALTLVKP